MDLRIFFKFPMLKARLVLFLRCQNVFATDFLRDYAPKTWEEIQDILNDEG